MSFFDELKRRNVFRVGIAYGIAAWIVLQVADLVLENIGAPSWVIQTLMFLVGMGFIAALIISWVYEITPEGIKREADVVRDESITQQTAKKLDVITLIAVAALLVFFAVDRFVPRDQSEAVAVSSATVETLQQVPASPALTASAPKQSIAVLPLINRSINPEDAFFAEGIHDEILTRLSRVSALKVISRTSVMGYAGTTKKMAEIGQELGVATLLEGGVQRAGNRVRINVQLIEAATDRHLWAEVFDRELTANNLFDIQSEITKAISDALQAVLTGEEQRSLSEKPTDNVEAYAYYLRGKASAGVYGRSPEQIRENITAYQSAIELDPQFAVAHAALANDWMELYWLSNRQGNERDEALQALQMAQRLAPEAADSFVADGYYLYWGFLDYATAIIAFDKALEKEPGRLSAIRGKAYVLRRMGRLEESITTMKLATSLDPLNAQMPADLGYTLLHNGQYQDADEMFRRAVAQNPNNMFNRFSYSEYFLMKNDPETALKSMGTIVESDDAYLQLWFFYNTWYLDDEEATNLALTQLEGAEDLQPPVTVLRAMVDHSLGTTNGLRAQLEVTAESLLEAEKSTQERGGSLGSLALTYALLGETEKLHSTIERFDTELKPDAMRPIENRSIIDAYAIIGDADRVFDYADKMVENFGPWELYYLVINPLFEPLRGEPRYKALALQYDRWLETVQ